MISLFRKLRSKMLNQNKVKRYTAYAIGEILLVVIGILIALELGDLKQERTERHLEKEYLERLVIDLENDLSITEFIERTLVSKEENLIKVRSYIEDPSIVLGDSVMLTLKRSYILGAELPNARLTGTFQELISTGNLRLIRNKDLRNNIVNFYSAWEHNNNRIREFQTEYITLLLQIVDRFNFFESEPFYKEKPLKEVLIQLQIENEFHRYYIEEINYMEFTKRIIERNKSLVKSTIDSIQQELIRLN